MTCFCASTRNDQHFHRFKRRTEWDDDDLSDDDLPGDELSTGDSRWLTKMTRMKTSTERTATPTSTTGAVERVQEAVFQEGRPRQGEKGAQPSAYPRESSSRKSHQPAHRRVALAAAAAGEYGGVMGLELLGAANRQTGPDHSAGPREAGTVAGALPARPSATSNARKLLTLWSSPSTLVRSVWAGVCTSRVFQARASGDGARSDSNAFARNPGTDRCPGSITRNSTVSVCRHPSTRLGDCGGAHGERLSPQVANDVRIGDSRRAGAVTGVTVLVIDEMDLLVTRTQQLLYNLFDWPTTVPRDW